MRQDIQCLRGVAILFVLFYHLYPTLFVNGFLGVDIFFVISGYLMSRNLTKSKITKISDFYKFYYRRFRRILPLYYLVIFIAVIFVYVNLGDFWWPTNRRYSIASLFVATNQIIISDSEDYFNQFLVDGSSMNAFIHLWSLGVEMQFYLIVPFIFFALQFLKNDFLRLIAVSLTTVIGFTCFALINPQFAFNFMPLRLWQFSAGFVLSAKLISEYSEKGKEKCENTIVISNKEDYIQIALAIISLCIIPNKIDSLVLRPLVTLATAFLITMDSRENKFLNSGFFNYIGNISYVIYLVHWPIIILFTTSEFKGRLFCVAATLIASILLHHLYEKNYLRLDFKALIPLVIILVLSNAYLQHSLGTPSYKNTKFSPDVQEIVDRNVPFIGGIEKTLKFGKCVNEKILDPLPRNFVLRICTSPKSHGNISVMMIGNSYTKNFNTLVQDQFKLNYSEFRVYSVLSASGFYQDTDASSIALEFHKKQVERYKPDVLFIIARYSVGLRKPITPNDFYINQINENIEFYERFVKKIYILDSLPLYNLNFVNLFLHYVTQKPEEIESLHLDKKAADHHNRYMKKRFQMVKCKKCQFFDLGHLFAEGDKYLLFDLKTMLSYLDNGIHITPPGLKLCEPVVNKLVKDIMKTIH